MSGCPARHDKSAHAARRIRESETTPGPKRMGLPQQPHRVLPGRSQAIRPAWRTSSCAARLPSSLLPQRRMLYVFDPTAMHSIIVKEQYVFEEAEFFIKSVRRLPTIKARRADSPYRTNRLVFGPGLLGTLGSVWLILCSIRHTNRMNVRGAPSETAQVTQPSVLNCSHATHDPYLHRCRT